MLISILSNSPNLLRVDLDGVTVLVPAIVIALEKVLPSKDAPRNDQLRRSAIQLLLSLLSLPLHFLVCFNEFICGVILATFIPLWRESLSTLNFFDAKVLRAEVLEELISFLNV